MKEIARVMLADGERVEKVMAITGLTRAEVERLTPHHKHRPGGAVHPFDNATKDLLNSCKGMPDIPHDCDLA